MTKEDLLIYAKAVKRLRNLEAEIRGYEDAELYSANARTPSPLPYDHGNAVSPDMLAARVEKRDKMKKRKEMLEREAELGMKNILRAARVLDFDELLFLHLRFVGEPVKEFSYYIPVEDFFDLSQKLGISRRKCFIVQRTILEKIADIEGAAHGIRVLEVGYGK